MGVYDKFLYVTRIYNVITVPTVNVIPSKIGLKLIISV